MRLKKSFGFLFFSIALSLVLQSCSSKTVTPENKIFTDFLKGTAYTHFLSACLAVDIDGRVLAYSEGNNCFVKPDGSWYSRTLEAVKFQDSNQIFWKNPIQFSHHGLTYSEISGNLLVLDSEFTIWENKRTRFDVLLVLNDHGKIVKRFSLADFWKAHPKLLTNRHAGETDWFFQLAGIKKNILELTHMNSFIELTRTEADGTKKVIGYLGNCTYQNIFFILNSSLTDIVRVIDLNGRSTHSVTQIDDNRLLFYRNSKPGSPFSSAEIYDLRENEFTTLYRSNNSYLSSSACSSVQLLNPEKLLLAHSQCVPSGNGANYGLAVEFVDLKNRKSFYKILHKKVPFSGTHLIDGKKFVESQPKL